MRFEQVKLELIKIMVLINDGKIKGNEIRVRLPCGSEIVILIKDQVSLKLVKND